MSIRNGCGDGFSSPECCPRLSSRTHSPVRARTSRRRWYGRTAETATSARRSTCRATTASPTVRSSTSRSSGWPRRTRSRLGALFVNFGGPGGTTVDTIHAIGSDLFGAVNDRFDIVGVDLRGVGQSQPSVDCKVNQETEGIYSKPFATPFDLSVDGLTAKDKAYIDRCKSLNGDVLRYISTKNTARAWISSALPWATRSSTTSASPTGPTSGRPTRAFSPIATARWCSTARST